MKLKIGHVLCASLLLAVSVGCGKEKSSGGSGSKSQNAYVGELPQNTKDAYNRLKNWVDAAESGSHAGYQQVYKLKLSYQGYDCKSKDLWFFDMDICSGNPIKVTCESAGGSYVVPGQPRSANADLRAVVYPVSGRKIGNVSEQSNIIIVDQVKPNGQYVRYQINKSLPGILNPVSTFDSETNVTVERTNLRYQECN